MARTYYDFAEEDRLFITESLKSNSKYGGLCAIAQNCCEKYFKFVIEELYTDDSSQNLEKKKNILRSHSLKSLEQFIIANLKIDLDNESLKTINMADGLYLDTRYPTDNEIIVTDSLLNNCLEAANECKKLTDNILSTKNKSSLNKLFKAADFQK